MGKLILTFLLLAGMLFSQTAKFPGAIATDQDMLVASDRASTTLATSITDTATTIVLTDGSNFVSDGVITIENERIHVCTLATNTYTVCTGGRGFGGSTAAAHTAGVTVQANYTSYHHNVLREELQAVQTALGANLVNVEGAISSSTASKFYAWDKTFKDVDWSYLVNTPATYPPSAVGTTTQVIYNDAGTLAGDAGLTFNKATQTLTVLGGVEVGDGTAASQFTFWEIGKTNFRRFSVVDALTADWTLKYPDTVATADGIFVWPAPTAGVSTAAFVAVTATPGADSVVKSEGDGDINAGWIPLDASYAWTGTHNFGSATRRIPYGAALPGTCAQGDEFQLTSATSGEQHYLCEGTSWTLQGDGGGGSGAQPNYEKPFTAVTSVSIPNTDHGFGHSKVVVACWDNSTPEEEIKPSKITRNISTYEIVVSFADATTGKCVVGGGGGAGTVTNAAALTADQPMFGDGTNAAKVGTKTGTGNQVVVSTSPSIGSPTLTGTVDMSGATNVVAEEAYTDAGWNGDTAAASRNNVRDEIEKFRTISIPIVIGNGAAAPTVGVAGYVEVPFACTIDQVTALADVSGSIVVDIWKDTYLNYPPTNADSITSAAPVTISSAVKSQDSTLTGWTTSIAAGDILAYNVDSASTLTQVTVSLRCNK